MILWRFCRICFKNWIIHVTVLRIKRCNVSDAIHPAPTPHPAPPTPPTVAYSLRNIITLYCSWDHWVIYYNMIAVFFPGFDRFIPSFDRIIPGFDRFIPASIPVTETLPPLQSKTYLAKKMYFLNLISSFFISLIWNNTIKKYSAMPRMHSFLKNTVSTNPKLFRAQFNGTGCRLWITAWDRSLQNVVNVTQKTLF